MNPDFLLDGACRLEHLGVIRATGADAATFLQGQLTNDVAHLPADAARLAGFCSAKGRLQATFMVWRDGDDGFLLACPRDLLAATLKRLSMFVLRAKCRLVDATDDVALWGAVGSSAASLVGDAAVWARHDANDVTVIRLPDVDGQVRAFVAMPPGSDATGPLPGGAALSLDAWRWLDVRSGVVTVEAATVDRFVPQMVNFELVGGVDFKKGCYPGQEVVARSQYRGTTKRRTFLFECDDALPKPGDDVFRAAGLDESSAAEPVGTVAMAASMAGRPASALVELRLAALDGGDLRLGAADGPLLRRAELPYPIVVEAEPAL